MKTWQVKLKDYGGCESTRFCLPTRLSVCLPAYLPACLSAQALVIPAYVLCYRFQT